VQHCFYDTKQIASSHQQQQSVASASLLFYSTLVIRRQISTFLRIWIRHRHSAYRHRCGPGADIASLTTQWRPMASPNDGDRLT